MLRRLGVNLPVTRGFEQALDRVRLAEALGYDSVWLSQLPNERDTAIVLAAYAQATARIGLGTFVLPIYTRHPTAMAQMAATLDELSGHRFRLGIGVSHKVTVEGMWGLELKQPVEAMREYLKVVRDSMREGAASVEGSHFTARWAYTGSRRDDLPIVIAALGPRMLELAGEAADGVALWMCSPGYIREQVMPHVRRGRERAGLSMDGFEVVAAVPVCLTDDPGPAREAFRPTVQRYASLPFYRKMMDASGFAEELERGDVSDRMVDELGGFGDSDVVNAAVTRYLEAGCTLPVAGYSPGPGAAGLEKTLEVLAAG